MFADIVASASMVSLCHSGVSVPQWCLRATVVSLCHSGITVPQ